jgi:hypothetical protein
MKWILLARIHKQNSTRGFSCVPPRSASTGITGGGIGAAVICHSRGEVIKGRCLLRNWSLKRQSFPTDIRDGVHPGWPWPQLVDQSQRGVRTVWPAAGQPGSRGCLVRDSHVAGADCSGEPLLEKVPQMSVVERDQKIEAFAANRAINRSERVRLGSLEAGLQYLQIHRLQSRIEFG